MTFNLHDKYTVISHADASHLSNEHDNALCEIKQRIRVIRAACNKDPHPEYLVLKKGTAAYHAGLAALMLEVRK